MITLTPYQPQYRQITLKRIEAFWGFHRDLVQKTQEQPPDEQDCLMMQDLESWTSNDHWLFVILQDEQDVGFVHLQRIGPIVVQLEDIFVDEPMRGQGIASQAILLACLLYTSSKPKYYPVTDSAEYCEGKVKRTPGGE